TLKGAALIELERYREALGALEQAIESDPDLALAWHELGYAAFRLGDRNRALLALDRAFALEPHTETLRLRGRILRDAGRYQAAEVAYEGAAQAAEHAEQRQGAEREIAITRRYAFYAPRRPEDLSPAERWFAETGTVVLAPDPGADVPDDAALIAAFLDVAHDSRWRFGQVVALGPALPAWQSLADGLGAPLVGRAAFDAAAVPLVVAQRALPGVGTTHLPTPPPPAPAPAVPRDTPRHSPQPDVWEGHRREPVRPRRRSHQPRRLHAPHSHVSVPRGPGRGPRTDGRRPHRGVHRLSHPAQRRARPLQGGDPLPPRRRPRRGTRARRDHDVEDRAHGHPVRRREGRRDGRPEEALQARARATHAALHPTHLHHAGPLPRHPRAGREHQRAGDGLDPG